MTASLLKREGMKNESHPYSSLPRPGAQEVAARGPTGGRAPKFYTHRGTKPWWGGIPAAFVSMGAEASISPPAPLSHPCYNEPAGGGSEGDQVGRTSPLPPHLLWTSPIPPSLGFHTKVWQ